MDSTLWYLNALAFRMDCTEKKLSHERRYPGFEMPNLYLSLWRLPSSSHFTIFLSLSTIASCITFLSLKRGQRCFHFCIWADIFSVWWNPLCTDSDQKAHPEETDEISARWVVQDIHSPDLPIKQQEQRWVYWKRKSEEAIEKKEFLSRRRWQWIDPPDHNIIRTYLSFFFGAQRGRRKRSISILFNQAILARLFLIFLSFLCFLTLLDNFPSPNHPLVIPYKPVLYIHIYRIIDT